MKRNMTIKRKKEGIEENKKSINMICEKERKNPENEKL